MSSKQLLTVLSIALLLSGTIRLASSSAVLIADLTMSVMIELSSRHPFCRMHTDRGDIQRMLLQSDQRRIRQVPRESVLELEHVCKDAGSYGSTFRGGLGFIYPGTKWCGPGTAAVDYNDLGLHTEEDRCCRDHDLCPNVLNAGECRRGLCNTGSFTRSHCDCDARLRRCLQGLNTETANTLGAIFYNVVQVTCFQERSPCSSHQRFEQSCPIDLRPSDFYVPADSGNLISRIIQKQYPQQSFPLFEIDRGSLNVQERSSRLDFDTITTRLGVKLASVGLVAFNIFKELKRNWPTILNADQNSYNYNNQYSNNRNEVDALFHQSSTQNRF